MASFWQRLFGGSTTLAAPGMASMPALAMLGTDMHSHLLPGLDDGAEFASTGRQSGGIHLLTLGRSHCTSMLRSHQLRHDARHHREGPLMSPGLTCDCERYVNAGKGEHA